MIQERRPGTARSKAEPSCDPIETVGRPETGAQTLIGSAGECGRSFSAPASVSKEAQGLQVEMAARRVSGGMVSEDESQSAGSEGVVNGNGSKRRVSTGQKAEQAPAGHSEKRVSSRGGSAAAKARSAHVLCSTRPVARVRGDWELGKNGIG